VAARATTSAIAKSWSFRLPSRRQRLFTKKGGC
jgi:hypothetical protein